jgi:hypothetical protein
MREECSVLGRDEIHVQNFDQETRNEGATVRTKRMWEDNNHMDHMEIWFKWIKLALGEVQ